MFDDRVIDELLRNRDNQGPATVRRRALITEVDNVGKRVRTNRTGSAWLRYPIFWSPIASDVGRGVELLQVGTDWSVVSVLNS